MLKKLKLLFFKNFKNNIKLIWPYLKDDKKYIILYIISNIFLIVINVVIPIFTARLIINLTDTLIYQLLFTAFIIFILRFLETIFDYLLEKCFQKVSMNSFTRIQTYISGQILKINNLQIDNTGTGSFIQRITKDASELPELLHWSFLYLANTLKDFGVFLTIFIINKIVFVFLIITVLIENFIVNKKSKIKNNLDKEYRSLSDSTVGFQSEFIRGIKDIKMLNSENSATSILSTKLSNLNKFKYNMNMTERKYIFLKNFASYLFQFGLIGLFAILIITNNLESALALVLYNYSSRVSFISYDFSYFLDIYKDLNLSITRVFELDDNKKFRKEKFGTKRLKEVKGNFEFKNVRFGYDDNSDVFEKLNFSIKPNTTTSFVGKSGSGKTTIFNLICKLYDIKDGEILFDGININELDKESIRGNIDVIGQSPYLFNMSIKDNLRLVKKDLKEDEMIRVCRIACIDDYINSLPLKYDTVIGENGVTLSGGQKQRLAIARALIQNTKIILFDEATSALDNETQKEIQHAIENMKGNHTILIIAHRLSTIVNSDKIMYLERGKIIAEGTHEELLKKSNEYRVLYEEEKRK